MIFKKFFGSCGVLFAVIAFFRLVNGASSFSVYSLFTRVQAFDFDYSFLNQYLDPFQQFFAGDYFGRFENIDTTGYALLDMFQYIGVFFKGIVLFLKDAVIGQFTAFWNLLVEVKNLVVEVYDLFTYVLGFR